MPPEGTGAARGNCGLLDVSTILQGQVEPSDLFCGMACCSGFPSTNGFVLCAQSWRHTRAAAGRFLFNAGITTFADGGDRVTSEFARIY